MMRINKQNLGSFLLCFIAVVHIEGWRPFKITIKSLIWETFNNSTNMNATLLNSTGAVSVFVEILENLNHPSVHTEIFADSGSDKYDFEIMNRTVDICELFSNKRYEPLLQIIYKILLESGPWPTACPVRKSRFSVENLIIDANKLPPYLPERKAYLSLRFANEKDGIVSDYCVIKIFFEVESTVIRRLKKTRPFNIPV